VSRRAAILLVLVCIVLAFAVAPFRAYLAEREQLRALEQQAQVLEQQNTVLAGKIAMLHDPTYLEHLARECLGMVKPGETEFVVVPADGKPATADC
jgi:cell division protein FtsB